MLFLEAISALESGKYVSRAGWEKEGKYLVAMPGMPHVWQILTQPHPNAGNYMFTRDDFKADDWKIFEVLEVVPKEDVPAPDAA